MQIVSINASFISSLYVSIRQEEKSGVHSLSFQFFLVKETILNFDILTFTSREQNEEQSLIIAALYFYVSSLSR